MSKIPLKVNNFFILFPFHFLAFQMPGGVVKPFSARCVASSDRQGNRRCVREDYCALTEVALQKVPY